MIQKVKHKNKINLIKNKFFENKIQFMPQTKNYIQSNRHQLFKNTRKNSRTKAFSLQNKKLASNFLKLIRNASKELQPKSIFKQSPIKFPVRIFLNKIPVNFENKLNGATTRIKNLPKNLFRRQKHLQFLRHKRKSKLAFSFYQP